MNLLNSRREFLVRSLTIPLVCSSSLALGADEPGAASNPLRFFFTSQGKTGLASRNGTELKYLEFEKPDQVTWQPGSCFPDGRRVVVLSMEARRDGPGRPFEEYYTQTPTHLWQYNLISESLEEICTKNRIAPFTTPALLLSDDRLLIQVVKNKVGQIYSVRLDGSDAREFTKAGEGLPYGTRVSGLDQRYRWGRSSSNRGTAGSSLFWNPMVTGREVGSLCRLPAPAGSGS